MRSIPALMCLFLPLSLGGAEVAMSQPDPFVMVLGVAQDGGVPHIGCDEPLCAEARRDPARRVRVSCLGIVTKGHVYLLDATPDLPSQAAELQPWRRAEVEGRLPVDGIFLTHAHIGHYLGLVHLGREAAGATGVSVWGTRRMGDFLRGNAPWNQLLRLGNIRYRDIGQGAELPGGVRVEAIPVPHREEYSDTVAYRIEGPARTVLYLPDIDSWDEWDRDLLEVLDTVDRAYVDGTFYSDDELPGRDMSKIPHPRVLETKKRLQEAPAGIWEKVRFIHLNHTNPLLRDPGQWPVAREGEKLDLGSTSKANP